MTSKIIPINSKVVIFGDFTVGKTSLLARFLRNEFGYCSSTVGASYNAWRSDVYTLNGKTVRNVIGFWDTAGQERFESLLPIYLRQADVVLFCWDSNKRLTHIELLKKINMVKNVNTTAKWFFVFTKTDLSDNIRDIEAEYLIQQELDTKIYYTSSKTNIGVPQLFNDIIKYIQTELKPDTLPKPLNAINISESVNSVTNKFTSCFGFL